MSQNRGMPASSSIPRGTGQLVAESRACPSCGYDLKGLFVGANCPECGRVIGITRKRHESHLIHAPKSYLRAMLSGLTLMSLAWLSIFGLYIATIWWVATTPMEVAVVNFSISGLWMAGLLLVLQRRPNSVRAPEDQHKIELVPLRASVLVTQTCFVAFAVFDYLDLAQGWAWASWVAMSSAVVGILGLVPLSYYLGVIAEWGRDESLAARFRSVGWFLAFFALLRLILNGIALLPHPALQLVGGFRWMPLIGILLCVPVVMFSVAQLAWGFFWLLRNAKEMEERDRRQAEKAARHAAEMAARSEQLLVDVREPVDMMPMDPHRPESAPMGLDEHEEASDPRAGSAGPVMRNASERVIPKAEGDPYRLADE